MGIPRIFKIRNGKMKKRKGKIKLIAGELIFIIAKICKNMGD
tara:strand:+ start:304 stop:429 length:126 start_codon:yes stop_codon:yes gene_type:complete